MIPYTIVLLAWMPVCALLLLDKKPARAFSLAVVVGMLILPSREGIAIVGLPDIDKSNATALGLFLGTLLFHPDLILRFKPRLSDAFLVLILMLAVATSVSNGFGLYDGLSFARASAFDFVLPIFLARLYLNTPKAFLTFLVTMVIGAMVYTLPALWEFRMSPQLHQELYGYFQHSFIQFKRGAFYRPVVCFSHALPLGRFMAFAAFLALFPLRPYLAQRFPGGRFYFLAPLLGLLLSMSWGPYLMFMLLIALYFLARKWPIVPFLLPLAAAIWLVLVFSGARPLYGVVDTVAKLNPARADSFKYRLDALEEYRAAILSRPGLGHGGWGNARTGRATDSAFLIQSLSRGLISAVLLYAWWTTVMRSGLKLAKRLRGSPLGDMFNSVGILVAICMAICAVDDALDYQILWMAGGVLALEQALRGVRPPLGAARPTPNPLRTDSGPVYVYGSR